MTADAMGVLAFVALCAAAWFVNYLLREWPAAKRAMFDAHADDALHVVDEVDGPVRTGGRAPRPAPALSDTPAPRHLVTDDASYAMHPAMKATADHWGVDRALAWYAEALPKCPDESTRRGMLMRVDELLDERGQS